MREEGWGNQSDFYKKALKRKNVRHAIIRIPERVKEKWDKEGKKYDPFGQEDTKEMIREYWQDLFCAKESVKKNIGKGNSTPWYKHTKNLRESNIGKKSKKLMERIR